MRVPVAVLRGVRRGIEKEGLRVGANGRLAQTPHPAGLGSALAHPRITTDFSESQLELITGVHDDVQACLDELRELHQEVFAHLGEELLWCASLPCSLPAEDRIPIARYGTSNAGRTRTLYREGLARRYGRRMQLVSGIHYNFSLSDAAWRALQAAEGANVGEAAYRDARYLDAMRNFRRLGWLLVLLRGASPAACASFVKGREHDLAAWEGGTLYGHAATSLRMGPLGYQSEAQAGIVASFNDLRAYAAALDRALRRPWPAYEAIGLFDGESRLQLATSLLQLENEHYAAIRPKRTPRSGERPLAALGDRGIEYLEVRCLDVDPFLPLGIDARTVRLLDVFLLHCLLRESPADSPDEIASLARDFRAVAQAGRDPATRIDRGGVGVSPLEWGLELLAELEPIADALDRAHGGRDHLLSVQASRRELERPHELPSARVLREVEQRHAMSFPAFVLEQSRRHRATLAVARRNAGSTSRYAWMAARSLADQRRIEAGDAVPFEEHLRGYLEQDLRAGRHLAPADR